MAALRGRRAPVYVLGGAACLALVVPGVGIFAGRARPGQATRQVAVTPTVRATRSGYAVRRRSGTLVTRGGGLATAFGPQGPTVHVAGGTLSLSPAGVGRHASTPSRPHVAPAAAADRVLYPGADVTEWYRNGPLGLEQGFTVRRRPEGSGRLTLTIRTGGSLVPRPERGGVGFAGRGGTLLHYVGLTAVDARGTRLPAAISVTGRTLLLRVDDARARYPLTIDPLMTEQAKLTGAGEAGAGQLGRSVALAADGGTALLGAPFDGSGKGAVFVFTRRLGRWGQAAKLTVPSVAGASYFGWSVALSADGRTALVGAPNDSAVWTFLRRGGTWTGTKLTLRDAGGGGGAFGRSVALSADGSTALVGSPGAAGGRGAVWILARSGHGFTAQRELVGTGNESGKGYFGSSLALSAKGDTALVGGPYDGGSKGALWTYTRAADSTWHPLGGKLVGSGRQTDTLFGASVALSANGLTAAVGTSGAVHLFTRTVSGWRRDKDLALGPYGGSGALGGLAMSADGGTVLIGDIDGGGGKGAAWYWLTAGAVAGLVPAEEVGDGHLGSVALAPDGNSALVGAHADTALRGAAWTFARPPTILSVTPASGPAGGGTTVKIRGTSLAGARLVRLGTRRIPYSVQGATQITAVIPPGPSGTVDLSVTTSAGTAHTRFTYVSG